MVCASIFHLILIIYFFISAPPRFTRTPVDQTGVSGGVASFICQATGDPRPKIVWNKKGKKVSNQRFEVLGPLFCFSGGRMYLLYLWFGCYLLVLSVIRCRYHWDTAFFMLHVMENPTLSDLKNGGSGYSDCRLCLCLYQGSMSVLSIHLLASSSECFPLRLQDSHSSSHSPA